MQSPSNERAGGVIRRPRRRVKRQATTPTRMTRSMLKRLNENGGPPVELNPGLDMGVQRRGPRITRPPKRPSQDEGVTGSVMQAVTKKRRGAPLKAKESESGEYRPIESQTTGSRPIEPKPVEPKPVEPQPSEPQITESQSTGSESSEPQKSEPKPIEPQSVTTQPMTPKHVTPQPTTPQPTTPQPTTPQPTTPQPTTPQPTTPQPGDSETRISQADIAAAARLAQAAIAAGLTKTTSEAGTPVIEDRPSLSRFTKRDLKDLLSEVVDDEGIRQRMEPHWLARTEFLTWWARPAAEMGHIKEQVRRLATRWSKDLQAQNTDDVDIPISMLESWRADLVIVGDAKQDTGDNEVQNEGGQTEEDRNSGENGQEAEEDNKKEAEIEREGRIEVKEQEDDKLVEAEEADDSPGLAGSPAENLTIAKREMAEWKAAFDKQIATEPEFRRRRAWTAIVLESQKEATALEEAVQALGTHKFGLITSSARIAAQSLVVKVQLFRDKLRMDRAAFRDEFDEEQAEVFLEKTQNSGNSEGGAQEDTRQDGERESSAEFAAELEVELQEELEKISDLIEEDDDFEGGAESEPEKDDIQTADIQARKGDARMRNFEGSNDLDTDDGRMSRSEPGPAEPNCEVTKGDSDPGPEHISEAVSTEGLLPTDQHDEPASTMSEPLIESNCRIPGIHPRREAETSASENPIDLPRVEKEERLDALPVGKLQKQGQEGEVEEAGEKLNEPQRTPCVTGKSGSHSPSRQQSGREQEAAKVSGPDAASSVKKQDNPFREARINMAAQLYRSATIEEVIDEEEHMINQARTSSDMTGLLTPETNSVASSTRSASPEVNTGAVENKEDSSSVASNISSLPENPGTPRSGRSETAEEVEEGHFVETAPETHDVIIVPEGTSLPQDIDSSMTVVTIESAEEVGGSIEETVENISPSSHIKRMLEEASMPRDVGASIKSVPPPSVEGIRGESAETPNLTLAPDLPQDTGLKTLGIPSGNGVGLGFQLGQAVEGRPATCHAAALPQRSSIGGDVEPPPAMSGEENPTTFPAVRYIKPQWEDTGSLFGPEEPTYVYSANEAENEDDDEGNEVVDSVEDRETDDVDP